MKIVVLRRTSNIRCEFPETAMPFDPSTIQDVLVYVNDFYIARTCYWDVFQNQNLVSSSRDVAIDRKFHYDLMLFLQNDRTFDRPRYLSVLPNFNRSEEFSSRHLSASREL